MTLLSIACSAATAHAVEPPKPVAHAERADVVVRYFSARDSLTIEPDTKAETREALKKLQWDAAGFDIACTTQASDQADATVLFPSPVRAGEVPATGDDQQREATSLHRRNLTDQHTVPLLWYAARNERGEAMKAPALVIVHSIHIEAAIAKGMAKSLRQKGVHAFVLFMPGFGPRQVVGGDDPSVMSVLRVRQAVAEIRRAYDAVAALPNIDERHIGLMGISLGTFAATAAQSLDGCYDSLVLLLGGADLQGILNDGKYDAETLKRRLRLAGVKHDELLREIGAVEPLLLAHRLNAKRTWLISAKDDLVIPSQSARKLGEVIGLSEKHHIWLPANHYTALMLLPGVVERTARVVKREQAELEAR